jgi:hypothetical protein
MKITDMGSSRVQVTGTRTVFVLFYCIYSELVLRVVVLYNVTTVFAPQATTIPTNTSTSKYKYVLYALSTVLVLE